MSTITSVVLDSTYVLPLFGFDITVSSTFTGELKILWKDGKAGCRFILPSACLVEVAYKLNKLYRDTGDFSILERYSSVLPTITSSEIVEIFNPHLDMVASAAAFKIRALGHADIMDCWIVGTAIAFGGILLTEESILRDLLSGDPEFSSLTVFSWQEFQDRD